jgi:hypothetical protein
MSCCTVLKVGVLSLLMQCLGITAIALRGSLPQEDHAVGAAGGGGMHQVFVVSWSQMADSEIAAAIA